MNWAKLIADAKPMLSKDPRVRPTIESLLQTDFFRSNPLINIIQDFLMEIRAISIPDKVKMFSYALLL